MPEINCAVKNTIARLEELIAVGSLPEPKSRRVAEKIVHLHYHLMTNNHLQ